MAFKIDGDIEYRCKSCGFEAYVPQVALEKFNKVSEFEYLHTIIIKYQIRYFDSCMECGNGFYIEVNIQQVAGSYEFDCDVISDNIEINGYCDVINEDLEAFKLWNLDLFDH